MQLTSVFSILNSMWFSVICISDCQERQKLYLLMQQMYNPASYFLSVVMLIYLYIPFKTQDFCCCCLFISFLSFVHSSEPLYCLSFTGIVGSYLHITEIFFLCVLAAFMLPFFSGCPCDLELLRRRMCPRTKNLGSPPEFYICVTLSLNTSLSSLLVKCWFFSFLPIVI